MKTNEMLMDDLLSAQTCGEIRNLLVTLVNGEYCEAGTGLPKVAPFVNEADIDYLQAA